jgi:hypothetical protein
MIEQIYQLGDDALSNLFEVTIPSVVATRNSSILHQKIYALYENAQLSSGQTINTGDGNWSLFATATPTLTNNLFKDSPYGFLNFSGGTDSWTVYQVFKRNNIKIDIIIQVY